MINNVTLVGRITKDPDLRKSQTNKSVLQFTVACDDPYSKDHTDFINCVVWNQGADYLGSYAHKGDVIALNGKINTRSYDNKNGEKVYVTEVICQRVAIAGSKREEKPAQQSTKAEEYASDELFSEPNSDISDEISLPFY